MAYTKTNWQDTPSTSTPITATSLNNMESGIENNDKRLNGTKSISNTIYVNDIECKNYANLGTFNVNGNNETLKKVYNIKPNTQYTLSLVKSRISGVTISQIQIWGIRRIRFYNGATEISDSAIAGDIISLSSGSSAQITKTFTTPANCNNIEISFYNGNGDTNINTNVSNIQLEIGTEATPYTPHKSFGEDIYTTDEMIIGTWIDGKPVYRKVINFGALPNASTKSVPHNISNLDTILDVKGTGTNGSFWFKFPHVVQDTPTNSIEISVSTTLIYIKTGSDRSAYSAYIILEYTKTTD